MTIGGKGLSKQWPVLQIWRSLRNSAISSVSIENCKRNLVSLGKQTNKPTENSEAGYAIYPFVHLSCLERRCFYASLRNYHSRLEVEILVLVSNTARKPLRWRRD